MAQKKAKSSVLVEGQANLATTPCPSPLQPPNTRRRRTRLADAKLDQLPE
jgi:hypothetical protein